MEEIKVKAEEWIVEVIRMSKVMAKWKWIEVGGCRSCAKPGVCF